MQFGSYLVKLSKLKMLKQHMFVYLWRSNFFVNEYRFNLIGHDFRSTASGFVFLIKLSTIPF